MDDLKLLQWMTLSASVHADALECTVDELRDAVLQLTNEDARLHAYETELQQLLLEQQRLDSLYTLVSASRRQRCEGEALRANATKAGEGGWDLDRWNRALTEEDAQQMQQRRKKRAAEANLRTPPAALDDTDSIAMRKEATDREVLHLTEKLHCADIHSARHYLHALEGALSRAGAVDVQSIIDQHVRPFSFCSDVEALWHDSETLTETEVESMLTQAMNRLTQRYEDAMELLQDTLPEASSGRKSELGPAQRRSCYAYAVLLGHEENPDASLVEALERNVTRREKEMLVRNPVGTATPRAPRCSTRSVLSRDESVCLPATWPAVKELSATPCSFLLPPVKSVSVPRFSFADVTEHQALVKLRVDIQRRLLEEILKKFSLWSAVPCARKERHVAEARWSIPRRGGDPWAWCTLIEDI